MDEQKPSTPLYKNEEGQPQNPKENLLYRINGLEKAKQYPDMTPQDIAALDRVIARLKGQLDYLSQTKREEKED